VARTPGILQQRPKLDGVVEGVTTRHELEQILPHFITDASDRHFLWASWEEPWSPIACGRGPIDYNRDWKTVNVLAISDASGILKRYRVCSDRDLDACLNFMADNVVSLPAADPTALAFSVLCDRGACKGDKRFFGEVSFEAATITLLQTRQPGFRNLVPPLRFEVFPRQLMGVTIKGGGPESVGIEIRFKPGTQPADNFESYGATPRDAWRLIWYVRSLKQHG
jgi:hypothetical protein